MPKKPTEHSLTETELNDMLAETVHTAFRKGSAHTNADQIWRLIRDLPPQEWDGIIDWMQWALFYAKKHKS